jgi:hypothetical protein
MRQSHDDSTSRLTIALHLSFHARRHYELRAIAESTGQLQERGSGGQVAHPVPVEELGDDCLPAFT